MLLGSRSGSLPWSLLTLVQDLKTALTVFKEKAVLNFGLFLYYTVYTDYMYYFLGNCTLELQDSAKRKGRAALFNCLVLGHTKYNSVRRVNCNPFPEKTLNGRHRLGIVMIRPSGVDNGAFVVSPETVWYARVLRLFSASAVTDTGSKCFECALVSTMETYDDPENGHYINYVTYTCYVYYTHYTH